ncbi:hypothetical protein MJO47_04115 [Desulfuromonas sp. KJ2020]|uniref:hypothetical protein n=1 Tax=Desulfuromonas sp. KJ2020 TaxID=2919173 RepID=UPI0020A8293D|nr:hypothetical protein [Desulfuromonas sp. KJ2020]MCP3176281.1 hypothetical protein [Desulfuromonas sp. KJ2020]
MAYLHARCCLISNIPRVVPKTIFLIFSVFSGVFQLVTADRPWFSEKQAAAQTLRLQH